MVTAKDYEQRVLTGWEDVHNKGQLSLWIMLALKDGAKYMGLIKEFIALATNNQLLPDDKSVYRSLRRFKDSELVDYKLMPKTGGPDLKIYELTITGKNVLRQFIERNISGILYQPRIRKLIEQ